MDVRVLSIIAIVLLLLIIGIVLFLSSLRKQELSLKEIGYKLNFENSLLENPDLRFNSFGWLKATQYNLEVENSILQETTKWNSDGYAAHNRSPLNERYGVIILHPVNANQGRYLEQEVVLPKEGKYKVYFGVAIAGAISNISIYEFTGDCVDVGFKFYIKDLETGKEYSIKKILREDRNTGKWHDFEVDLGNLFNSKKIVIGMQSFAADSGCGFWNGEWLVVDYLSLQPS